MHHDKKIRRLARRRGHARGAEPSRRVRDAALPEAVRAFVPLSERVVCPCGCIFQAVSETDECWTCGRSASAVKAEESRIVAGIRGLPEVDPHA